MKPYDEVFGAVFDAAKKIGAKDVEANLEDGASLGIRIFKQDFESFDLHNTRGIGVRVLNEGSFGYAFSESFETEALEEMVRLAFDNARLSPPNEVNALPALDKTPEPKMNLFNEELDKTPVEKKIELAKRLEKAALEADPLIDKVSWATYGDGSGLTRVANTNGVDRAYRSNLAYAVVGALAKKENDVKSGFDFKVTRNFREINPDSIARTAAKRAVDMLGAQVPASGSYPVILTTRAMISLLSVFSAVFSAKNVQMGKSLLAGKLGQTICKTGVTIVDDALLPNGYVTRPFDAEGVISRRLELLTNGVLNSYLHNTISARKDGVASTGHAARGGFKGSVEIAPSNFYIVSGKMKPEDLEKSVPEAIRIEELQGLHAGCNPISGDFSSAASGFLLKNGEVAHPLNNFTVSGNFLKMLDSVDGVANNLEFLSPSGSSCFGSPTLLVSGLSIAGK